MKKTVIACAVVGLLASTGTATAANMITGKDIKNGTVAMRDLTPGVQALIKKHATDGVNGKDGITGATGHNGKDGVNGTTGRDGAKGADGANGTNGANGKDFNALPEDFYLTNWGQDAAGREIPLTMTAGGVKFGPYPVGNEHSGSVAYTGYNGKLSDITKLSYTAKYTADNGDHAAPYLRLFLSNGRDVIFSPSTQQPSNVSQGEFHTYDVTAGTVRYNDDEGNYEEIPWSAIAGAATRNLTVTSIKVSAGNAGGTNLRAFLSDLSVNDKTFHFGA